MGIGLYEYKTSLGRFLNFHHSFAIKITFAKDQDELFLISLDTELKNNN